MGAPRHLGGNLWEARLPALTRRPSVETSLVVVTSNIRGVAVVAPAARKAAILRDFLRHLLTTVAAPARMRQGEGRANPRRVFYVGRHVEADGDV